MKEVKNSHATKEKLTESLKKLMKEKSLNKISIKEITEGANMNRQTFYYHFDDIYAQLKWMYQEEGAKLLENYQDNAFWQEGLLDLFRYVTENKEVHLCVLKSVNRDLLKKFYTIETERIIRKVVFSYDTNVYSSDNYGIFLSHFFTLSLGAFLESYILGEINYTPEEMVELFNIVLCDLINGSIIRRDIYISKGINYKSTK